MSEDIEKIPAAVVVEKAEHVTVQKPARLADDAKHLESTTTVEEDLHSLGQRRINLVWEYTQSFVALLIVFTTCVGIFIGRVMQGSVVPFPAEWWTIVGLVIGFYFGRTNHSRVGGVQLGR